MDKRNVTFWVLVAVIALAVFFGIRYFIKPAGATVLPIHTEWVNKGSPTYGTCVAKASCGTSEGTRSVSQKQECKLQAGAGSFPCSVGQYRYVESEESCEVETPVCEEPPVVIPPKEDDDDDGDDGSKCKKPRDISGFRYMWVDGGTRLRWTEQDNMKKVDIKVYGADKSTFLYYVRTNDDGEYFFPNRTNWYRIRGVNNCGLGDWSRLIN